MVIPQPADQDIIAAEPLEDIVASGAIQTIAAISAGVRSIDSSGDVDRQVQLMKLAEIVPKRQLQDVLEACQRRRVGEPQ